MGTNVQSLVLAGRAINTARLGQHAHATQVVGRSRMKRLCVAVVDDEPAVRKGLSRLLRTADFEPRTYESAQAFLDDLAHQSPDCVVVDLQMPGISGMDLQATLRRTAEGLPVIIVTARDDQESHERCLALGAAACLVKPLDCETLVDVIHSVVASRD